MISVSGLTVRYGTAAALDRVSLTARPAEWVGLIGPNGAGKTTLLRAVARLIRADGELTLAGEPARGLSHRRLARLVGYVPQDPVLPPGMTVGEYVLLGRTPHIGYFGIESAADRRICSELLDRLDLAPLAARSLGGLSGGEAQRLVLARALAQEAPILLLDEPTSALDLGRRVEALELIDELRRERSLTILSAIHDLTLAGQFADRLVLLADGRVAAAGTPAQVLTEELLRRHFGADIVVLADDSGNLAVLTRRQPRLSPPRPLAAPYGPFSL